MVTSSLELPLTPHRKWGKGKKRARKSFQKFPALVKKYHTSNFPVAHGHDDDKYDDKRATHKLQYDFMLLAYLSDIKFTCMQIVPVGNKRRLFFGDGQRNIINRHIQSVISQKQNKKSEKRGLEAEEREARKLEARNVQGC